MTFLPLVVYAVYEVEFHVGRTLNSVWEDIKDANARAEFIRNDELNEFDDVVVEPIAVHRKKV